jgi:hypothetical protein
MHAESNLINMVVGSGQQPCGLWAGIVSAQPRWARQVPSHQKKKKKGLLDHQSTQPD